MEIRAPSEARTRNIVQRTDLLLSARIVPMLSDGTHSLAVTSQSLLKRKSTDRAFGAAYVLVMLVTLAIAIAAGGGSNMDGLKQCNVNGTFNGTVKGTVTFTTDATDVLVNVTVPLTTCLTS
jgi:hypothetical protein